jgi:hypothetical protein
MNVPPLNAPPLNAPPLNGYNYQTEKSNFKKLSTESNNLQ